MAVFNISDESGTEEKIIQEGTAGSDTFIIGTNNGKHDPIVNGLNADGWGTDPATLGGEDQFILNNLESKTVFIANLDPSKDKIFLPEGVKKGQIWIQYYLPYVAEGKEKSEFWLSYRPDLNASKKSTRLEGEYSTNFEIKGILFSSGFKGCQQADMPPSTSLHDHYLTYLEAKPEELTCLQGYAPSIRARKLSENNPDKIEAIQKEQLDTGLFAEVLNEYTNPTGNKLAVIEAKGHNPEDLINALYFHDGSKITTEGKFDGSGLDKNTKIKRPEKFNKKSADKITNFNTSTDTLEIDTDSFGIESPATFAAGKNKKAVKKKLTKQDFDFLYDEKKGGIYFNENGSDKGFGEGGIIAILKGAPDLTSVNLEFI
jgi:hypothetical protein